MLAQECDDKGRLLLPKDIRERYGGRFVLVQMPKEVILLPIPKDPLAALRAEGKKIPKGVSIAMLRKKAREDALREALATLRR